MYPCESCSNNFECATCNSSKFRELENSLLTCTCMEGYYDDGGNELCLPCSYDCLTC